LEEESHTPFSGHQCKDIYQVASRQEDHTVPHKLYADYTNGTRWQDWMDHSILPYREE
jgi:hypothetical protein